VKSAPDAPAPTTVDPTAAGGAPEGAFTSLSNGDDGTAFDADGSIVALPAFSGAVATGLQALERIDPFIFNILCVPVVARLGAHTSTVLTPAVDLCERRRAFLIVDVASTVQGVDDMVAWMTANGGMGNHAAVYFPRVSVPDPLSEGRPRDVGPSGTMAGLFARTDASRGVWKAPAGTEAAVRGVTLQAVLNDQDSATLNPIGVNVLRNLPIFGNVAWGARTLQGADQQASEWKYIPVRRTALYIEESLRQGLQWVVFEPNDEPLWSQIRLNVGAFMQTLFRQGAFQGRTPREAYFVKCDKESTTQTDIDRGVVNILVGFAPLKPAEFVVIQIQQMAGHPQT
jgi:phage tail sheath protein FI